MNVVRFFLFSILFIATFSVGFKQSPAKNISQQTMIQQFEIEVNYSGLKKILLFLIALDARKNSILSKKNLKLLFIFIHP